MQEDEEQRRNVAFFFVGIVTMMLGSYAVHCVWATSEAYSSPSIVLSARSHDGKTSCLGSTRFDLESVLKPLHFCRIPDHIRRLPRGLLVAADEHQRGRQGHVLVGLRVPDHRHGKQVRMEFEFPALFLTYPPCAGPSWWTTTRGTTRTSRGWARPWPRTSSTHTRS